MVSECGDHFRPSKYIEAASDFEFVLPYIFLSSFSFIQRFVGNLDRQTCQIIIDRQAMI